MKQREGFGREIESQGRVHERVDFIETKSELVRTQLEQVAVRTEPTDGERGILSRHDHELDTRRHELQERGDRGVGRRLLDEVVVVEDDDQLTVDRLECFGDLGGHRAWLGRGQPGLQALRGRCEGRLRATNRFGDGAPQRRRVAHARTQHDPGEAPVIQLAPLDGERRLPVSRRRDDQHEPFPRLDEPRRQPLPRNSVGMCDRRGEPDAERCEASAVLPGAVRHPDRRPVSHIHFGHGVHPGPPLLREPRALSSSQGRTNLADRAISGNGVRIPMGLASACGSSGVYALPVGTSSTRCRADQCNRAGRDG